MSVCEHDLPHGECRVCTDDWTIKKQAGRIAALEASLAEARKDAADGWEAAVDWAGYAPEHFQQKHDLAGDIKRLEAARDKLKETEHGK